jgi:tRNA/rRNA methyltransferase
MGENIGAAARAMWNFGLDRMRVVAPRDGWPNPKLRWRWPAGRGGCWMRPACSTDLSESVADCTYVYATTARARGLTKPVLTPEAAMAEARPRKSGAAKAWRCFSVPNARG